MAESKSATNAATAKAPGASAVRAIANEYAASFTDGALEEAHDALRARYVDAGGEAGLTPMQRKTLDGLTALRTDIVKATTVPASSNGAQS